MSSPSIELGARRFNLYKYIVVALSLAYSVYGLVRGEFGNVFFTASIAFFTALHEIALSPKAAVAAATFGLRHHFQRCEPLARLMLIVIAVGGTAMVVDIFYDFSLLPPFLDFWVKRAGIPLVILTFLLNGTGLVSNLIYRMSETDRDQVVRAYELCLYVSVALLALSVVLFFMGYPLEKHWPHTPSPGDNGAPATGDFWNTEELKLLGTMSLIFLVWSLGFLGCVLSRYFEWTWGGRRA